LFPESAREALINAAMRSFAAYTKPQEVWLARDSQIT